MPRNTEYYGFRQVTTEAGETIDTSFTRKRLCNKICGHSERLVALGHPVPIIYEIHDDCGRRLLDVHVWDPYGCVEVLDPRINAEQCRAGRDWAASLVHRPDGALDEPYHQRYYG